MSESEEDYAALMREAVPAARNATDGGALGVTGAKGGTRALLGRALLATLERAEDAEAKAREMSEVDARVEAATRKALSMLADANARAEKAEAVAANRRTAMVSALASLRTWQEAAHASMEEQNAAIAALEILVVALGVEP